MFALTLLDTNDILSQYTEVAKKPSRADKCMFLMVRLFNVLKKSNSLLITENEDGEFCNSLKI